MNRTARLAGTAALATSAAFAFASPAVADNRSAGERPAVFVQTDELGGNQVIAYQRNADGTLTQSGRYATGGTGGRLAGAAVDFLASQGSLVLDDGLLYVTNAGSNTISAFVQRGDHLARIQVISSGGTFPVSIAAHGDVVYVLNARDGGSVQGYRRTGAHLTLVPSWHRSLGLDPNAAPEFTHTPGQVAITPDGSKLVVTTKAGASSIDVFGLDADGSPSDSPVVTPRTGAVPFAVTFDPAGHLVLAEAGSSLVVTFAVQPSGALTVIDQKATGQAATCWIAGSGNNVYASNAGSASVSGYRTDGSGSLTALGNTGTDKGTVDASASSDRHNLYVQTGAAGIVDEYAIGSDGSLTKVGSVTVPNAAGSEGIAAS